MSPYAKSVGLTFQCGKHLTIVLDKDEPEVVKTALDIFTKDYKAVFGGDVLIDGQSGVVYVGTIGYNSLAEQMTASADMQALSSRTEGFLIVEKTGKLIVLGSDKRGTAYGILELSRMIGVSPWEWWADSPIKKRETFTFSHGFRMLKSPSVAHRGIFLNDEDWGLTPWSYKTHEPSDVKGQIGPQTHARIFELLLRLRANTFWPAMHSCSVAFYLTPGNKEMADRYAIMVGTSHCEPMVRNTNAEWKVAGTGDYNYLTNREGILKFWKERVIELAGSDNIYTLGLRGKHDGKMQGAKTLEEQKNVLVQVLKDQREMITDYVNPNVEKVSQVFIPYKEVLDVYNMGLEVPEDVSLLWCDDNYGYIRHFPTREERARKGGNGVYYHISYWGRPHDYLWLATNHPAQLYTQMKLAYDKGAQNMWILNVGDIKPGEYLTELFLDMAWDINGIENNRAGLDEHLYNWMAREFGNEKAGILTEIMTEYYRLAYIRKPEFLANTRSQDEDLTLRTVRDLPWSEEEINRQLKDYAKLEAAVIHQSKTIPAEKRDTWFQLLEYPVRSAAQMNYKHLYGQLARHNKADWALSDAAYDTIQILTATYNTLNNGKWRFIMDSKPRNLPVFQRVPRKVADKPMIAYDKPSYLFNGVDFCKSAGAKPISHGLGYQRGAVSLPIGSTVEYHFDAADSIRVEVALAPNHPVEGKMIRFAISIDNSEPQTIEYQTEGRSVEWYENVLTNQARRTLHYNGLLSGNHVIKITALDEGVIVDQIKIYK